MTTPHALSDIEKLASPPDQELQPVKLTPEERAEKRREEILDAAAKVFAEKGYHDAGVSDIASEMGVAHGTFYRYFKSKQEIANRVLDRIIQRIAQAMLQEDPEASETLEEWHQQIQRIIGRLFEVYERHPHFVRFLQRQPLTGDDVRLAAAMDSFATYTARFVQNGQAKGFVRADVDAQIVGEVFVGVLFDLLRRLSRDPTLLDRRDHWTEQSARIVLCGVAAD